MTIRPEDMRDWVPDFDNVTCRCERCRVGYQVARSWDRHKAGEDIKWWALVRRLQLEKLEKGEAIEMDCSREKTFDEKRCNIHKWCYVDCEGCSSCLGDHYVGVNIKSGCRCLR